MSEPAADGLCLPVEGGGDGPPRLSVASTLPVSFVDGPGNRFTLFLQGCNLDCFNCHNPTLIGPSNTARWRTVDDVLEEIARLAPFLSGVTVSGGEATLQLEGVLALFAGIKADERLRRLTTFVDSNGTLDETGWRRLAEVMDAAMIDVKAVGEATHRTITGAGNEDILATVRLLHGLQRLHEVRLLVIEGLTDTDEELSRYAAFLAGIDATIPLRLLAYRWHGVRAKGRRWPETRPQTMERVATTLRAHGLKAVHEPVPLES